MYMEDCPLQKSEDAVTLNLELFEKKVMVEKTRIEVKNLENIQSGSDR